MSWTFCTSGAAIAKAGANANTTIVASGATLALWSDEVESILCDITRTPLITQYSSLTSSGKQIISSICSAMIAQRIIGYDMSGYTSRLESQIMLDILENDIVRNVKLIEEDKVKTFLTAT